MQNQRKADYLFKSILLGLALLGFGWWAWATEFTTTVIAPDIYLVDSATKLYVQDNHLCFEDATTGTKTLAELVGDMEKATYDTDTDDIVDKAESVDDGAGSAISAANVVALKDREKYADSPMAVSGGLIAVGTNAGTFKVLAITSALLRTTDSVIGELTEITLAEQDNQAISAADTVYYAILNYNGGSPTITTSVSEPNGTTNIELGIVMKDGSNNVHYCNCGERLGNGVAKLHKRALNLRSVELASGCTIAYQATREFTMTAGVIYEGINHQTPFAGGYDSSVDEFTYCYRDTDVWQYTASDTDIDDDYYDNNTAEKGSIGVTKYGVHWVYVHPDDEHVYVVYGRDNYSLAEAVAAQPPGDLPNIISEFSLLIGKIVIVKDGTAFAAVQMVTDYFFTGTAVADHGALGGLDDPDHPHYQLKSLLTTKGDIYIATGAGTVIRLPIGANDEVFTADSGEASGAKWAAGGATGKFKIGLLPGAANLIGAATESEYNSIDGTNFSYDVLLYDDTTTETCYYVIPGQITKDYGGGNFTAKIRWMAVNTYNDVVWRIKFLGRAAGEAFDSVMVTAENFAASTVAATSLYMVEASKTITASAAKLTAGDTWVIAFARLATDATDTMTGDAKYLEACLTED